VGNEEVVPTSKRNTVYLYYSEPKGNIKSFGPVIRSQRGRIIIKIYKRENDSK
jgi:hypothetical protein